MFLALVHRKRATTQPQQQTGFSLIELMVAMLIGLIVSSGALMAYSYHQQTVLKKQQLDAEQDALRYLSTRMASLVRNSLSIEVYDGSQGVFGFDLMVVNDEVLCPTSALSDQFFAIRFQDGRLTCNGATLLRHLPEIKRIGRICVGQVTPCPTGSVIGMLLEFDVRDLQVLLVSRQAWVGG